VVSNKVYQNRVVWTGETRDGMLFSLFLFLLFFLLSRFARVVFLSSFSCHHHLLPLKTLEEGFWESILPNAHRDSSLDDDDDGATMMMISMIFFFFFSFL